MTDEEIAAAARRALMQGEQEAQITRNVLPVPDGTILLNTKDDVNKYLLFQNGSNPSSAQLKALKERIKEGVRVGRLRFLNRPMTDYCYKLLSDRIKAKEEQEARTGKSPKELADIDSIKKAAAQNQQEEEMKIRQEVNRIKQERGIALQKTYSEKQKQDYQEAVRKIRAEVEEKMQKKTIKKR